jgi:pyridoxal phosphate enzyme (YggS family)
MVNLEFSDRIGRVRDAVSAASARSGRNEDAVTIVAVSKTVGREVVDQAYDLGLRHFGENRVLDTRDKYAAPLPDDAVLHLIGQLQTNKAQVAARLFDLIESVDRISLIDELTRQGVKLGRRLPVLLQVNVAGEDQKAGCDPSDVRDLVARIESSQHLELQGLMTMAPFVDDVEGTRPTFRGLRELRDALVQEDSSRTLSVLSMGMSNDYPVAIEEGATHVRIGRAIFGA